MHQILNTLYVMTQGAYLHLDHDTVKVEIKSPSPDLTPAPSPKALGEGNTSNPAVRKNFKDPFSGTR